MKRHILVVAPYPPPHHGTSVPTEVLVEWLRSAGHRVEIVNKQSRDKSHVGLLSARTIVPFLKTAFGTKGFLFLLLRNTCVLVMGSNRYVASAGCAIAVLSGLLGKRMVLYIHGGGFDVFLKSINRIWRSVVCMILRACVHRVVAQTERLSESLRSAIPNIVHIQNWTVIPANARVRRLSAGCNFFYIGELRVEKGIVHLLRAFHQVRSVMPATTLDLIGPLRPGFKEEFVRELGSGEGVRLHGELAHEEAMSAMARCDVLVFPTRFPTEGYPGAVIESFARGIPVIATAWRAAPEIVKDGVNGLLVDPDNIARELPQAMLRLAGDPELYERLSAGALESAKRFDIEAVGPQLLELWELRR